jgi:ERF superfamily
VTDEPAVEPLKIHEALAAVMLDVQEIVKGDRNKQQNFSYRGIDAVLNAVGPVFRAHGVVCVPIEASYTDERYITKSEAHMRGVTVRIGWRFYGPAGDWIDAVSLGEAADAGDKAVPKASSVAYRTLLLQALCIPVGDEDPDATSHERAGRPARRQEGPQPVPVPKSWAAIEKLVRARDNPEEAWLLFLAFTRAAAYHLFGAEFGLDLDPAKPKEEDAALLKAEQWTVLGQKAAGAAVWMAENVQPEGPFFIYDEALQRQAWASVLEGHLLPIPDYVPPEPPAEAAELDEEAARAAELDAGADYQ